MDLCSGLLIFLYQVLQPYPDRGRTMFEMPRWTFRKCSTISVSSFSAETSPCHTVPCSHERARADRSSALPCSVGESPQACHAALWESLYNGKSTIFHLENKCMFLINYEEIINPKFIIKAGVQTKPNCYWCYTTKPII